MYGRNGRHQRPATEIKGREHSGVDENARAQTSGRAILKRRPWPRAPLANQERVDEMGASGDRSSCPSPQQSGREC